MLGGIDEWAQDADAVESYRQEIAHLFETTSTNYPFRKSHIELTLANLDPFDPALLCIADVIQRNCPLAKLVLNTGTIGLASLNAFSRALRFNTTLQELEFNYVHLDPHGLSNVMTELIKNKRLRKLAIRIDSMEDFVVFSLCDLFVASKCLESVDLTPTKLSSIATDAIIASLRGNTKIIQFQITGASEKQQRALKTILSRNQIVWEILNAIIESPGRITRQMALGQSSELTAIPVRARIAGRRFTFAQAETIGRRNTMEDKCLMRTCFRGNADEHVFAVFDGHGGVQCAVFVASNFLDVLENSFLEAKHNVEQAFYNTFARLNEMCRDFDVKHGTCALVCYFVKDTLYVVCAGDSNAVLCRGNDPIMLAKIYRPSDPSESERIKAAGGFVSTNGRVGGLLAVSRSLGDNEYQPFVSGIPTVEKYMLQPQDNYICMACDGVWDVLSPTDAGKTLQDHQVAELAVSSIRTEALVQGSTDNISSIVIKLD